MKKYPIGFKFETKNYRWVVIGIETRWNNIGYSWISYQLTCSHKDNNYKSTMVSMSYKKLTKFLKRCMKIEKLTYFDEKLFEL